jgi:PAS domain S-box-containing protein
MARRQEPFGVVLLRIALTAAAYVLLARVSLQAAVLEDGSSVLWLPAGVAVGLTYWWGYRVGVPGAVAGIAIMVWLYWGRWELALLSGLTVGAQPVLAVWLLRRLQVDPRFRDWRSIALFAFIGIVAIAPPAAVNAYLTHAFGVLATGEWTPTAIYRWMGDWLGYLLMGSFLLVWWGNLPTRKRDGLALIGMVLLVGLAAWLSFYLRAIRLLPAPSLALLLPPMALGAIVYQQRGATLLTLSAALLMAIFAKGWGDTQPLEFRDAFFGWLFLAISFCTLMVLAGSVTQQRQYARQLEHSRRELEHAYQQVRNILDNAPSVAMQMYDEQGRVLFWNRASEKFYGYTADEALGKTLDALIFTHEEQQQFLLLLHRVRDTGQPAPLHEWETTTARGEKRTILSSLFPIDYEGQTRFICADIDITERKALERRLFQAEKLESIGQLAGGVAHDFNNLLTAILGFAELAQGRLPKDHPAQQDLERIVQASMRAANLVRQLLGFARKQLTQPRPISVNAVIQDLLPLLQRSLGENIRLQLNLTDAENTVFMDPAQFEQVVMNLVLNARDAMQNKGGGTLTIATTRRTYTKEQLPAPEGEELSLGECVCLIVEDTGEGVPPEIRERIFEPFFSTKGVGNTGLGLATVYGIVRQNKGFVTVESEVSVGTRFTVCLPAWLAQVQSHADDPSRTPPDAGNH